MKDGAEGASFVSALKLVEVGTDDAGNAITSCAIVPVEGAPQKAKAQAPTQPPIRPGSSTSCTTPFSTPRPSTRPPTISPAGASRSAANGSKCVAPQKAGSKTTVCLARAMKPSAGSAGISRRALPGLSGHP